MNTAPEIHANFSFSAKLAVLFREKTKEKAAAKNEIKAIMKNELPNEAYSRTSPASNEPQPDPILKAAPIEAFASLNLFALNKAGTLTNAAINIGVIAIPMIKATTIAPVAVTTKAMTAVTAPITAGIIKYASLETFSETLAFP